MVAVRQPGVGSSSPSGAFWQSRKTVSSGGRQACRSQFLGGPYARIEIHQDMKAPQLGVPHNDVRVDNSYHMADVLLSPRCPNQFG